MPLLPTALAPNKAYRRISFRNIVWATHSESHEVLLQAATASCENGKMTWDDAKRLGVFLWLRNPETLKAQMEVIARNRFMSNEDRDPTGCSLLYFTLGKKQVVHGLWRQAPGHKEQSMMIKFLANDFTTERWKTAAMKNAYALLSKQRYGKCLDTTTDNRIRCSVLYARWECKGRHHCVSQAVERLAAGCCYRASGRRRWSSLALDPDRHGHANRIWRWPSMAWKLDALDARKERPCCEGVDRKWVGGKCLQQSPMEDIAAAWEQGNKTRFDVGNPDNDDPSLLLLFQHLKAKTLQTAKGTSEVPAKLEFDFVLHNARVFCRMGECISEVAEIQDVTRSVSTYSDRGPLIVYTFPPRRPSAAQSRSRVRSRPRLSARRYHHTPRAAAPASCLQIPMRERTWSWTWTFWPRRAQSHLPRPHRRT